MTVYLYFHRKFKILIIIVNDIYIYMMKYGVLGTVTK